MLWWWSANDLVGVRCCLLGDVPHKCVLNRRLATAYFVFGAKCFALIFGHSRRLEVQRARRIHVSACVSGLCVCVRVRGQFLHKVAQSRTLPQAGWRRGFCHLVCTCAGGMVRERVEAILGPVSGFGRVLDPSESRGLDHICRCMELVSKEQIDAVCRAASTCGSPLLHVHMSDGLSCRLPKTTTSSVSGQHVVRVGRATVELLLELVVVEIVGANGKYTQSIKFHAPRSLSGELVGTCFFQSGVLEFVFQGRGGRRYQSRLAPARWAPRQRHASQARGLD